MKAVDRLYEAVVVAAEGVAENFIALKAPALARLPRSERARRIDTLGDRSDLDVQMALDHLHDSIRRTIDTTISLNELGPLEYRDAFDLGSGAFWNTVREEMAGAVATLAAEGPVGAHRALTLRDAFARRGPRCR